LKRGADDYLKSLQERPNARHTCEFFGQRLRGGIDVFILAHACKKRGHDEQARQLIDQSRRAVRDGPWREKPKSFHQDLIDGVAAAILDKIEGDFGDSRVTRKELLARFEWVLKHFPEGENDKEYTPDAFSAVQIGHHRKMAESWGAVLRIMVAEDEEHARRSAKSDDELNKQERIAELIFRLRDQNEDQHLAVFAHLGADDKKHAGPSKELLKLGYDAMPQLIDALQDDRFTRTVVHYKFAQRVVRVGESCQWLIRRISGRNFGPESDSKADMSEDQKTAEMKKNVQAWWTEFQKNGEKQMLIEGTQAGDSSSVQQGRMLSERYPDVALVALNKGIVAAKHPWDKAELLTIAAKIKGDATTALLRRELKSSAQEVRVAAARGLHARDHADGVKAMIDEWQNRPGDWDRDRGVSQLITFLAECNRPEAIQVLGKDLRKRPIAERLAVMEEVWKLRDNDKHRLPATVATARDELLVQALDDVERYVGLSGGWGDKCASDPRICDLAGHFLSRVWKQPEAFDLAGTLETRDRQRFELQNIWRKKQGIEALPMPK
jgi:hypothetical protein